MLFFAIRTSLCKGEEDDGNDNGEDEVASGAFDAAGVGADGGDKMSGLGWRHVAMRHLGSVPLVWLVPHFEQYQATSPAFVAGSLGLVPFLTSF